MHNTSGHQHPKVSETAKQRHYAVCITTTTQFWKHWDQIMLPNTGTTKPKENATSISQPKHRTC